MKINGEGIKAGINALNAWFQLKILQQPRKDERFEELKDNRMENDKQKLEREKTQTVKAKQRQERKRKKGTLIGRFVRRRLDKSKENENG